MSVWLYYIQSFVHPDKPQLQYSRVMYVLLCKRVYLWVIPSFYAKDWWIKCYGFSYDETGNNKFLWSKNQQCHWYSWDAGLTWHFTHDTMHHALFTSLVLAHDIFLSNKNKMMAQLGAITAHIAQNEYPAIANQLTVSTHCHHNSCHTTYSSHSLLFFQMSQCPGRCSCCLIPSNYHYKGLLHFFSFLLSPMSYIFF